MYYIPIYICFIKVLKVWDLNSLFSVYCVLCVAMWPHSLTLQQLKKYREKMAAKNSEKPKTPMNDEVEMYVCVCASISV